MFSEKIDLKSLAPYFALIWVLSVVTSLAIVSLAPGLFPVRSEQLPDGLITTSKVANEAIVTSKLANGTVTSAKVLDGTITAQDLGDGSVISVKISAGAVQTEKLADGAVTGLKLANSSVTTSKITDGSVTSQKIADGSVLGVDIADGAIVTVKLADGSVSSAKILDGTITATDLADGSVTSLKITDGSVTTAKLADGAVIASKLSDGSVTAPKLGPNAIPLEYLNSTEVFTTMNTGYYDMPAYSAPTYRVMNVSVTVDRPSDLLIMLSASSYNTANGTMYVRALINEYQLSAKLAWPVEVPLASGSRYASNACNFLYHATAPGTYKIYIQWRVDAGIAYLSSRSLTVIVLP